MEGATRLFSLYSVPSLVVRENPLLCTERLERRVLYSLISPGSRTMKRYILHAIPIEIQ